MLRGEFRCGNGRVIPNNVTIAGAGALLAGALRNIMPTLHVGLGSAVYQPDLTIQEVVEPTIGTNGYARQAVARDSTGWPVVGTLNGECFIESLPLVWTATGPGFNVPITRLFLCGSLNAAAGDVLALSAALPEDFTILPATPEVDRTFKYRLYLR